MRFAVDTWAPDYGTSREENLREASRPVDIDVELPADRWRPVSPDGSVEPAPVVTFVDGVRRIDARIWISDAEAGGDEPGSGPDLPGVCATVAAGAVRCTPTAATVEAVIVERALFTAAEAAEPVDLNSFGCYRLKPLPAATDEALYLAVHRHMTSVEEALSAGLDQAGLVLYDGPLGVRQDVNAAGYVKSQHVEYLTGDDQRQVLTMLAAGQRTPLFHIGGDLPSWSWYTRLPGPRTHSTSGIVRLELPGFGDPADAAARADLITATLPRFASEAHKDSRAPQNLYPIAGLERELRRRLGDPKLLDRALRARAADRPMAVS
jgi:hypothetical protein